MMKNGLHITCSTIIKFRRLSKNSYILKLTSLDRLYFSMILQKSLVIHKIFKNSKNITRLLFFLVSEKQFFA